MRMRRLRLLGALGAAGLVMAGLVMAGRGALGAPPLGSWAGVVAWYDRVGPATAVVAAVRLAAMLGAGWLGLGALVQLLASLSLSSGIQAAADLLSPRVLRPLAHGVASLSVTAGLVLPALPTRPVEDPPGTAVMELLDDEGSGATTPSTPPTTTPPTPSTPPTTTPPAPTVPPAVAAPVGGTGTPGHDEIRVEAGDSFWSIAQEAMAEAHPAPSEQQVAAYWQRLIDANRARLTDPSNPDLLYADQILVLPAA